MRYFAEAGLILVEVFFGLAVALFALRVLLQLVRANFYNPICQLFYKATNPVLMPLRRVLRPWRNWDLAGTVVAGLLVCLKVLLIQLIVTGRMPGFAGLLVLGVAESIAFLLGLYFWLILIRVILSFVGQGSGHPVVPLIMQLTEPVLRPLRRLLPPLGGFDLSPLLATLAIMLAGVLVVAPLSELGTSLLR